jgi:NAD(P)H-dependent flavin oxidoreductase YrpB (nitropropane dioxygenase family)
VQASPKTAGDLPTRRSAGFSLFSSRLRSERDAALNRGRHAVDMLTTPVCELFGIAHPVVLGGMGLGTNPDLVAAVSNAGGLGIQGCGGRPPEEITQLAAAIRDRTDRPFGLNLLLFRAGEAEWAATLATRPPVVSTAWAKADQPLAEFFTHAHEAEAKVLHMVSTVPEAARAAEAGADAVVAQGTEGGGHVGLMGTMVLVPMVARAIAPVPVIAAGGLADGAGLAAVLMLGAHGALFGTRFLATTEASIPETYKQVLVDSDGHNTVVTELPDVANTTVWPGAYARIERNRFYETWAGREGELRYRHAEAAVSAWRALEAGDTDNAFLYTGQTAGLIDTIEPARVVVERIVTDATERLRGTNFTG